MRSHLLSCLRVRRSWVQRRWLNTAHPDCNVPPGVLEKVGRDLHKQSLHPLGIIKAKIEAFWRRRNEDFQCFDSLDPIVSTAANFDSLLIPQDHVSRRPSDTYYVDGERCLRTHTSAHQVEVLNKGVDSFLLCGDVYRRDEIDRSHYPVFHQMEGVKIFTHDEVLSTYVILLLQMKPGSTDLREGLESMACYLFGDVEMRWVDAYFPFTEPSAELEILFGGEWLEVLGCGVIHQGVLDNAGRSHQIGWAFGLGLERLAMVLFSVPDIRLFWSQDPRFLSQFQVRELVTFKPYSRYPPCHKDVTFWIPDGFHENDLCEAARELAGDLIEEISLRDTFTNPKTERVSCCYRITYRSMDRSLTDKEVNDLQEAVRGRIVSELGGELR
ncbi:unnamed protein product [Chrysoparadoxa australica]